MIDHEDVHRDVDALEIWTELDSLATNPLYANLHRVDVAIFIRYPIDYDEEPHNQRWVQSALPQKLPLLASKRILHLAVVATDCS